MPMHESLCIPDIHPTREPNMNTTTTTDITTKPEQANFLTFRIFVRFVVGIVVGTAIALYLTNAVGCTPSDYPGAPEAAAAPHNEAGDLRSVK